MPHDPQSTTPPSRDADAGGFLRSAGAVGFVTLLSRLSGLLREFTRAHFLGTSEAADCFRIALLVPNLLRRLVGEGAMAAGFVPVLSGLYRRGDREGLRILVERFYTLWTVILLGITALGMLAAGSLLALYAGALDHFGFEKWSATKLELTAALTRWLFIYLGLIGLSAVGQAVLNTLGIFALPAVTPLLYNLAFSAAGFLLASVFPGEQAVWSFVIGVLVGGVLQFLVLVPALWRQGIRLRPRAPARRSGIGDILRLLVPATFGAGVYQFNALVSVLIAGALPEGSVSSLEFSARLMEFVLGVFVFALSTVGLTALSRLVAAADGDAVRTMTSRMLRLTWFITLPSTVGLLLLGEHVIRLLLVSGAFDEKSVALTLKAFRCHIPGLIFVGLSRVMVSVFYAHRDVWVPVRIGLVNLVINAALCVALSATALSHGGIALAATIAAVVQAVLLLWACQRRFQVLDLREIVDSSWRAAVAALAMTATCLAIVSWLPADAPRLVLAAEVAAVIAAGMVSYFGVAWLLGSPEVGLLLTLGRRKK